MIVAVDPSIRSCGIASARGNEISRIGIVTLSTAKGDYVQRATAMATSVIEVAARMMHPKCGEAVSVLIETPMHWQSYRGLSSEASEDIQKLYWFVGTLVRGCMNLTLVDHVYVVRPTEWKGHTPKPAMVHRSMRYLQASSIHIDASKYPHDTHEAVCLAMWGREALIRLDPSPAVKVTDGDYSPSIRLAPQSARLSTASTNKLHV